MRVCLGTVSGRAALSGLTDISISSHASQMCTERQMVVKLIALFFDCRACSALCRFMCRLKPLNPSDNTVFVRRRYRRRQSVLLALRDATVTLLGV